ncbi:MAG: DUF4876 domain-containing protein [Bacteroidetes bacterium]|nr:DUF4876 domain-containing protein [Bacteroidota bacterium]MBU1114712.1 DUF4876 domain-containing protein [Bacteroidota bacterium]MBU1798914.1 DUF4876 domain-containing protein [Bacteroidota bacterium]
MKKILLPLLFLTLLFSCQEKSPLQVDGEAELRIVAVWNNSAVDSIKNYISLANSEMILVSEYGIRTEYTDENGILHLKSIPSAVYQISARGKHPLDATILLVGNLNDLEVLSGMQIVDTIFTKPISSTGISINEIYAGGPVNSIFFFYDQFIELYNSSNEVKYLDGMQIFRVSGTDNFTKDPGDDWDDDDDIDGISYAFKFPGRSGEKNYPFEPQTFVTIAQDAIDHSATVGTSIDLSKADWEFVNQFNAVDFDNPKVPNLISIRLDKTSDFMISLTSDIIVLASGVDTVWEDGIDIETILDGVEYQSSNSSRKTLDDRIDRGWVQAPPKYNGESMQRREKGIDTNDGTLDWNVIPKPTPGWQ